MASLSSRWTRQQLLVAFSLYCRIPFGKIGSRNPEIIRYAKAIGRSPAGLSMKLGNIASLDPAITASGRTGLRATSANDRAMWEEMQNDWERFAIESQKAMSDIEETDEANEEEFLNGMPDRVGEDRVTQATTRVGQNFFRRAVMSAYDGRCCITGLSLPALLVASHIVPWTHDKNNRVNPRNGLLLSMLHDKAFDTGIITIDDDMTVRVSQNHAPKNDQFFASSIEHYEGKTISLPEKFTPNGEFLAYHREYIFKG